MANFTKLRISNVDEEKSDAEIRGICDELPLWYGFFEQNPRVVNWLGWNEKAIDATKSNKSLSEPVAHA